MDRTTLGNGGAGLCNAQKGEYRQRLEHLASHAPLFINSQTGKDYYTLEQNLQLFDIAREISDKYQVAVMHETHRGNGALQLISLSSTSNNFLSWRLHWMLPTGVVLPRATCTIKCRRWISLSGTPDISMHE